MSLKEFDSGSGQALADATDPIASAVAAINLYTDPALNIAQQLALDSIVESPFNPRTNYPEAEAEEMTESARAVGIVQPILVRPLGGGSHEIVFGHRRFRGAKRAELPFIPAFVRELTDAQSAQLQAVENVQRKDLDEIDEALGYAAYIEAHGVSKDALAQQIGKSRTHVYSRLKLATLLPPGQAALRAGKINAEVATLVARVPSDKMQAKALEIALERGYHAEPKSVRAVRAELNEKFTLALKGALWDLGDETLLPAAGSCHACPKRSGSDTIIYADLFDTNVGHSYGKPHGPDVCTDPDCFAAKKTAQLKLNQTALEGAGKTVIAGGAARKAIDQHGNLKGDYIPLKDVREAIKKAAGKGAAPKVATVTIQDPRNGKTIEAIKRDDAKAAGVKVAEAKPKNQSNWQEQQKIEAAARVKKEAAAQAKTEINLQILRAVRAATASKPRTTHDLQLIAYQMLSSINSYDTAILCELHNAKSLAEIDKRIGSMPADQLATLMLDCALVVDVKQHAYRSDKPEALLAAAKQAGIDVAAIRKAAEAKAAPTEKPAAKPAKSKKKAVAA